MVPTCYGRQAIRYEFEGLRMCSTSALIDSNRAAECKALLCISWMLAYRTSPVADKFYFLRQS